MKYAIADHIASTFEKVIAKIQRGPDFMNHGVACTKNFMQRKQ